MAGSVRTPTTSNGSRKLKSNFMQLTCITSGLPPRIDGVGDYSLSLAREFREGYGINTNFLVGDPTWIGEGKVEAFSVRKLTERKAAALNDALPQDQDATVLLHYGGYAYAQRGCPGWLVDALTTWRMEYEGRRLVTIFHELYASGPPWSSSFWLSRRQRNLTEQLARLSDRSLTSRAFYAELLRKMGGRAESLPVFSSIGEPDENAKPLSARRRRLVVFGTRGRRVQVYRRSANDLNRVCRDLAIEEVLDIGREMGLDPSRLIEAPVVLRGELPGHEVQETLLDSIAGVIDYPADMLGKSTIFAAYCAHRMIPLVAGYGEVAGSSDGLVAGVHYHMLADGGSENVARIKELNLSSWQTIADNALDWYQDHTLAEHARILAASLLGETAAAEKALVMT